ncbi:melanoma-associated antigen G1-like protein [Thalictrum thalictroides]|uniref:Melanoma-associated antigen G1-like protein n=1 Tax=Thalictrum thalictroides TaxID=46969 RepID=A0A7J6VFP8_THATH|nr:melanoma-associated antigen G1-like protein [Thalictrum thalictroides]
MKKHTAEQFIAEMMAYTGEDFSQIDISKEEKDKLVSEVVRYMLFKTHQNSGCPIKREELTQIVTKNYRQRALPALVINEAKDKLSSIFGYEMRELQRSRPSTTNQSQPSVTDSKSYVIISKLSPEGYGKYVEDTETCHTTGFTFAVIGIVHLAGGKIAEDSLWHHLHRLGLNETDESHPILGNLKQALEALVQQRYLQKNKVNGPEGNTLFYELAERALDQSVNQPLKEYISQIVNKDAAAVEIGEELTLDSEGRAFTGAAKL